MKSQLSRQENDDKSIKPQESADHSAQNNLSCHKTNTADTDLEELQSVRLVISTMIEGLTKQQNNILVDINDTHSKLDSKLKLFRKEADDLTQK